MELKGIIIESLEEQSGISQAGTNWRSKDYVMEVPGKYPKKVCFNLYGDNIDKFTLAIGQEVNVSFDIDSREWNGRWFTTIKAWRVETVEGGITPNPVPPVQNVVTKDADDSLPF